MPEKNRLQQYIESYFETATLRNLGKTSEVFDIWNKIVGKLSSHCRLADIEKGTLIVDFDHPGWMQQFQMQEKTYLKEIQRRFPDLEIKSFKIRLIENLGKDAPAKENFIEPTMAPTQEIPEERKSKKEITDLELKNILSSFEDLT